MATVTDNSIETAREFARIIITHRNFKMEQNSEYENLETAIQQVIERRARFLRRFRYYRRLAVDVAEEKSMKAASAFTRRHVDIKNDPEVLSVLRQRKSSRIHIAQDEELVLSCDQNQQSVLRSAKNEEAVIGIAKDDEAVPEFAEVEEETSDKTNTKAFSNLATESGNVSTSQSNSEESESEGVVLENAKPEELPDVYTPNILTSDLSKAFYISDEMTYPKTEPWNLGGPLNPETRVYRLLRVMKADSDEPARSVSLSTTADDDEWPVLGTVGVTKFELRVDSIDASEYASEVFRLGRIFVPKYLNLSAQWSSKRSLNGGKGDPMDLLPRRNVWIRETEDCNVRDVLNHFYLPVSCIRGSGCSDSQCVFSHSKAEIRSHPLNFGRINCRDGSKCRRKVCTFTHSEDENIVSENRWLEWETTFSGWRQNLDLIKKVMSITSRDTKRKSLC